MVSSMLSYLPTFIQLVSGKAMIWTGSGLNAENPRNHQGQLSLVLDNRRLPLQMPAIILFARWVMFCLDHGNLRPWLVFFSGTVSFIS